MNVHKIVLCVIDMDNVGGPEICRLIEDAHYPNHCIAPEVVDIETADIGEFDDDHPLNSTETANDFFIDLFCKEVFVDGRTVFREEESDGDEVRFSLACEYGCGFAVYKGFDLKNSLYNNIPDHVKIKFQKWCQSVMMYKDSHATSDK